MSTIRCMGCMQEYEDTFDICPQCGYGKATEIKEDFQLIPGTILNNKYIAGRVLSYDKSSITYLGWDAILETKVTIKEYFPQNLATRLREENKVSTYDGDRKTKYENGLETFLNAGVNLTKFNYITNIVQTFDSFTANNTGYVVMEYLEGESILDMVNKQGKFSYQEAINIIMPILNSLSELHNNGVVHGNISPKNILIVNGNPKLIDFNFEVHSKYESKNILTTKGYSPIESYRPNGKIGPWTDIYSVCTTLYFMLTAKRPVESLKRENEDTLQSINKYARKVPSFVVNAITSGLSVNPKDRIQSIEELCAVITGNKKTQIPNMKKTKNKKKSAKGKVIAIILIAVFVLSGGGVLFYSLSGNNISNANSSNSKNGFTIDKILGKTVDEASKITKKYKKTIAVKSNKYDDGELLKEYKIDTIVEGTVNKDTVNVVVYGGKKSTNKADADNNVLVPNLYGMSQKKAVSTLKEYGLKHKIVYKENDYFVGQVFEQSEKYDTKVKVGSSVTITVGKPVPTTVTTTVPVTQQPTTEYVPETYPQNDNDNYQPPVTQAPVTEAPVTQPPFTQPPITENQQVATTAVDSNNGLN